MVKKGPKKVPQSARLSAGGRVQSLFGQCPNVGGVNQFDFLSHSVNPPQISRASLTVRYEIENRLRAVYLKYREKICSNSGSTSKGTLFYSLSFPLSINPPQSCLFGSFLSFFSLYKSSPKLSSSRSTKESKESPRARTPCRENGSDGISTFWTFFLIMILHMYHLWHWSKASLPLHLSSLGLDHLPLLSDRPYLESERDDGGDY